MNVFISLQNGMKEQFILIGGGTARFTDRPSILEADYAYTPIYREIASFVTPCTHFFREINFTIFVKMISRNFFTKTRILG